MEFLLVESFCHLIGRIFLLHDVISLVWGRVADGSGGKAFTPYPYTETTCLFWLSKYVISYLAHFVIIPL